MKKITNPVEAINSRIALLEAIKETINTTEGRREWYSAIDEDGHYIPPTPELSGQDSVDRYNAYTLIINALLELAN